MAKVISPYTGREITVSDDRLEKYKAAGYKPAALPKPVKKTTKKKK